MNLRCKLGRHDWREVGRRLHERPFDAPMPSSGVNIGTLYLACALCDKRRTAQLIQATDEPTPEQRWIEQGELPPPAE